MAKAKKGKGGKAAKGAKGKKGAKKGKKEPEVVDPNVLTEVDKTFYELQLADLNRKLARLRSLTEELQLKNEELETNLKTMDEDRGDIIMYLKRTLEEKSDEITDLQNRLVALQETRESEAEEFQRQIAEMQQEYKMMQEQLTSEIKLLNGKLNSLEEFRVQRDDLMKKYEIQEKAMEEQEARHKREIYEIEKKFIIGKDRLKKEMEDRLLQLSSDFQDATNLRIAATTHRVIRENIAINNELDVILETHKKLHEENETLKERDRGFRMQVELHEAEKDKALAKSKVQYNLIDRLTTEHEKLTKKLETYQGIQNNMIQVQSQLRQAEKQISALQLKNKILEQNIHASRCDRVSLRTDLQYYEAQCDKLTELLVHASMSIKAALRLKPSSDESITKAKRENLLKSLLDIVGRVYEQQSRKPSLETVPSCSAMYRKGDLGFVPVTVELRSTFPTRRNIDTQVGSSLEDLRYGIVEGVPAEKKEDIVEEEELTVSEESLPHQRELNYEVEEAGSQVLFDEPPEPLSASSEHGVEINLLDLADTKNADVEKAIREGDEAEGTIEEEELEEDEEEEEEVTEVSVSGEPEEDTHAKVKSKVSFADKPK